MDKSDNVSLKNDQHNESQINDISNIIADNSDQHENQNNNNNNQTKKNNVLEFFFKEYHMLSNGEKLEINCTFLFQILNHCRLTKDLTNYIKKWIDSTINFDSYHLKLVFLKIIVSIYISLKNPKFKNPINALVDELIRKDRTLFNLIKNHPVLNKIYYSIPIINNPSDLLKWCIHAEITEAAEINEEKLAWDKCPQ
ncbi:hypothetical protein ACTFIZ_004195 [Dictyostelium cf. discoideum]